MKLPLTPNLQLGITDRCNLSCYMCRPSLEQSRKKGSVELGSDMPLSVFRDVIGNCSGSDFDNLMLCWVGEPLLHQDFFQMLRILREFDRQRNFFRILSFNTNGVCFDRAKIDEFFEIIGDWEKKISVVFSLDAIKAGTFSSIKKVDFWERVESNVRYFFEKKASLGITGRVQGVVQFLVLPENESESLEFYYHFKNFFENQKLNWELKFEMDFALDNGIVLKEALLRPQNASRRRFERVKEKFSGLSSGNQFRESGYRMYSAEGLVRMPFYEGVKRELHHYANRPPCISPFIYPAVHVDGRLTVCCRDNGLELSLGNLANRNFEEIWWGTAADRLRLAHLESKQEEYPLCFFCGNYTEYFLAPATTERLYQRKFPYQSQPEPLDEVQFHQKLERIFFHSPDISLAGMLHGYFEQKNPEKLLWLYQHLLERKNDQKAREILASLRYSRGEYQEVLRLFESEEGLNRDCLKLKAQSLISLGNVEDAARILEQLCLGSDELPLLKMLMGLYHDQRDKSISLLPRLIELDHVNAGDYRRIYAQLLLSEGKMEQAWESVLPMSPKCGRAEICIEIIREAVRRGLDSLAERFMFEFQGNFSEPETIALGTALFSDCAYNWAFSLARNMRISSNTLELQFRCLTSLGLKAEAAVVAEALAREEDNPDQHEFLFHYYHQSGQFLMAARHLRKLRTKFSPEVFRISFADLFENAGKYRSAFRKLQETPASDNFTRRVSLLEKIGDFEKIIRLYDESPAERTELHFFKSLLDSFWKLGRYREGAEFLSDFQGLRDLEYNQTAWPFLIQAAQYEKALEVLRPLEKGSDGQRARDAKWQMILVLRKLKRPLEAFGVCLRLWKSDKFNPRVWKMLWRIIRRDLMDGKRKSR
ncbi:MAG: SPASM domain-containing protein [Candidatus Wallbacteria bacterium]|nr:SPASM domain-containing protein [Candidatus Wallbacteria bacterium]